MMFLLSASAHFTNDLRCLFICFLRRYGLLLGAIIMMGVRLEGVSDEGIQGKKMQSLIDWMNYFLMIFTGFAWQLQVHIQDWRRVKESFDGRQRGLSFTESGHRHNRRGEGASDTSTKHRGLSVWAPDIHKVSDMCSCKRGDPACKVAIVSPTSASECTSTRVYLDLLQYMHRRLCL